MKLVVSVLGFVTLLVHASGQAVNTQTSPLTGPNSPYDQSFAGTSVQTISGKISGIGVSKPSPSMPNNVRLILQSTGKTKTYTVVELGPQWYMNAQKVHPKLGQVVKVTGAKIREHGQNKLVASQVVFHNHDVLTLRRMSGLPYWVDRTAPKNSDSANAEDYAEGPTRLAAEGTILQSKTFQVNGVQYLGYVIQTANGPTNVIVAPADYAYPTEQFAIGNSVRVFSGGYIPDSTQISPGVTIASSVYSSGGQVFYGPGLSSFPGFRTW